MTNIWVYFSYLIIPSLTTYLFDFYKHCFVFLFVFFCSLTSKTVSIFCRMDFISFLISKWFSNKLILWILLLDSTLYHMVYCWFSGVMHHLFIFNKRLLFMSGSWCSQSESILLFLLLLQFFPCVLWGVWTSQESKSGSEVVTIVGQLNTPRHCMGKLAVQYK